MPKLDAILSTLIVYSSSEGATSEPRCYASFSGFSEFPFAIGPSSRTKSNVLLPVSTSTVRSVSVLYLTGIVSSRAGTLTSPSPSALNPSRFVEILTECFPINAPAWLAEYSRTYRPEESVVAEEGRQPVGENVTWASATGVPERVTTPLTEPSSGPSEPQPVRPAKIVHSATIQLCLFIMT